MAVKEEAGLGPYETNHKHASTPARSGLPIVVASLLAVIIAIATTTWALNHKMGARMPPLAVSVLMPAGTTIKGAPAVAPDGRAVAFAAVDAHAVPRIWLRSFDRLDARALAGTEGGDQPFWSPDSRSLGFFARGKLSTVDTKSGSGPRALADVSDPHGGTWSRDGTIVYSPQSDGLYRTAATGGPAMPLTTVDRQRQGNFHRWPRFLPDGRMILFVNRVAHDDGIRNTITTVSVDGRDMKPIVDAESTGVYSNNHLLFLRAGKLFAQPFDAIELRLSGEAVMVADSISNDAPGTAGLVGFDAIDGLLVSRPRIESSVIHLLFNWPATLAR